MGFLTIYLLIGLLWTMLHEGIYKDMGMRMRFLLLWPVTFVAFIIGLIDAWKDND